MYTSHIAICKTCSNEKGIHRFSALNNMDPGDQPTALKKFNQVEEMLIARVGPILQVKHAMGGQYKYRKHTIIFPQDIQTITKILP